MPELPEALGAALERRYSWGEPKRPITHGQGRQARMHRLEKVLGGGPQAAAAAGIPRSSWGHMKAGKRGVSPKNLGKLEAAFTRLVMRPAMTAAVAKKGAPNVITVKAVVVADPDGQRYVNGYKRKRGQQGPSRKELYNVHQPPAHRKFRAEGIDNRAVINAWLNHGNEAAAQAYEHEVERQYGEPFGFEGNHAEVEFE